MASSSSNSLHASHSFPTHSPNNTIQDKTENSKVAVEDKSTKVDEGLTGSSSIANDSTPPLTPSQSSLVDIPKTPQTPSFAISSAPDSSEKRQPSGRGKPSCCLFVASLSSSRTDEQLFHSVTSHFMKFGKLMNVKVLRDTMQRPYSFVQFENKVDSDYAMKQAQDTILDGRHIRVEKARVNRTIYITSTAKDNPKHTDIESLLSPFGEIEDMDSRLSKDGKVGFFALYAFREDAIAAYSSLKNDRAWSIEWAQNIEKERRTFVVLAENIDASLATKESIIVKFNAYGIVKDCTITSAKEDGNVTLITASITYDSEQAATLAVEKENRISWLGRVLYVKRLSKDAGEDVYDPKLAPAPSLSYIQRTPPRGPSKKKSETLSPISSISSSRMRRQKSAPEFHMPSYPVHADDNQAFLYVPGTATSSEMSTPQFLVQYPGTHHPHNATLIPATPHLLQANQTNQNHLQQLQPVVWLYPVQAPAVWPGREHSGRL